LIWSGCGPFSESSTACSGSTDVVPAYAASTLHAARHFEIAVLHRGRDDRRVGELRGRAGGL
jgi:hypothetical protein